MCGAQEMKQIAGRAGRFGTAYAEGVVTTLHAADLALLHASLQQPDRDVAAAGNIACCGLQHLHVFLIDSPNPL